jgi:Na+-driven multidrug efflux pump
VALLFALAMITAGREAAAAILCTGVPAYVSLGSDGALWVNAGYGVWAVCSVAHSWTSGGQSVVPETCRAWYAAMLRQHILGLPIAFYFNDLTSCAAIGSWVVPAPAPYHMDIYGS